jgi:hypothetical protein
MVGVQIVDPGTQAVISARTTLGVVEYPADTGIYTKVLTAPTTEGQYLIVWDTGIVGDLRYASEDLVVAYSAPVPYGVSPPGLAQLTDVKRVAKVTTTEYDADLTEFLATADEIIRERVGNLDLATGATTRLWDVRADGYVPIPRNVTVTAVRTYPSATVMSPTAYEVQNRRVRFRAGGDLFGALDYRQYPVSRMTYDRVEVDYTTNGIVPKPVRDAVAILATHLWRKGGGTTKDTESEKIGEYNYKKVSEAGVTNDSDDDVYSTISRLILPWTTRGPLVA